MRLVCLAMVVALVGVAPAAARMPVRLPRLTLAPLTWDDNVEQARVALTRAKMAPVYSADRRYMAMTKDHPFVEHTTEPGFSFVPRKGWVGHAHFVWDAALKDYRIDRVVESAEGLSPGALADELAALTNRYGEPQVSKARERSWQQAGTTLGAGWYTDPKTKRSSLTIGLRLDRVP